MACFCDSFMGMSISPTSSWAHLYVGGDTGLPLTLAPFGEVFKRDNRRSCAREVLQKILPFPVGDPSFLACTVLLLFRK